MSSRLQRLLTCWVAGCALLLKAAVPLLAAMAAHLQGVPVASVCSLYGVATSQTFHAAHHGHVHHHATSGADHDSGSHSPAEHGQDHCALTAVVAMAAGPVAAPPPAPSGVVASRPCLRGDSTVPDACALWVARLGHGPPVPV